MKFKKYFIFVVGAIVMGLGIGLCNTSKLGTDPLAVLCSGISISFPISFSMVNALINVVQVIVAVVLDKKQVTIFSLVAALVTSYSISLIPELTQTLRYLWLMSGIVCMSLGIALMVSADIGKSPYDAFIYSIMSKTNQKYSTIRWACDLTFLVFGYLLHGIVGVGTILGFILIGKLMEIFLNIINRQK